MKKLSLMVMLLASVFVSCDLRSAHAGFLPPNYFRPIGTDNYQVSMGALFSSHAGGQAQLASAIAVVTHSTKDGSLLPAWLQDYIAPEDWSPIAVSFNNGGGNTSLAFGPVVNVSPQLQLAGNAILSRIAPNSMANVKSFLQKVEGNNDISVAIGPMLNLEVVQNGTIMPFNRWAVDPLRYFAGASWKF